MPYYDRGLLVGAMYKKWVYDNLFELRREREKEWDLVNKFPFYGFPKRFHLNFSEGIKPWKKDRTPAELPIRGMMEMEKYYQLLTITPSHLHNE